MGKECADLTFQSFGAKRISWQNKGAMMYVRTSKVKEMCRNARSPVTSWILANATANKKHKARVKKEIYANISTSVVSLKFSILTFRVNVEKIMTSKTDIHMYPRWIPYHTKKVFWSLVSQSSTSPTTLYGGLKSTSIISVCSGSTVDHKRWRRAIPETIRRTTKNRGPSNHSFPGNLNAWPNIRYTLSSLMNIVP